MQPPPLDPPGLDAASTGTREYQFWVDARGSVIEFWSGKLLPQFRHARGEELPDSGV